MSLLPPSLLHACTDLALLSRLASSSFSSSHRLAAYLGVDPTASSMHVGHLVGVQAMRRLADKGGFKPVGLVGGATALIGGALFFFLLLFCLFVLRFRCEGGGVRKVVGWWFTWAS